MQAQEMFAVETDNVLADATQAPESPVGAALARVTAEATGDALHDAVRAAVRAHAARW